MVIDEMWSDKAHLHNKAFALSPKVRFDDTINQLHHGYDQTGTYWMVSNIVHIVTVHLDLRESDW